MAKVIYPGTFDPVTKGHIDIIDRAVELFDEVIVTVAKNPGKTALFSVEERVEMLKESLKGYEKVRVDSFDGLVVDHAKNVGAVGIIRGLRAVSDFEYEFQMALMNRKLAGDITTILLMPHARYTYLNSTIIRNLAQFHGNVAEFVTPIVLKKLNEKFPPKKKGS
ncbi:MAG: pantetheine-phosphate adenylyltransferase [Bacteroidetes bacterium]|nr:pantetheine-phosphate adenylyltransferase [Bacteroidota bacterium]MCL6097953.1 pantetheine-phosphate adenylyltransferase [Bacteroidota bacterium]